MFIWIFCFIFVVSLIKRYKDMNTKKVNELKEMAEELINCGNSKEIAEGYGIIRALEYLKPTERESQIDSLSNYAIEHENDNGEMVTLEMQLDALIETFKTNKANGMTKLNSNRADTVELIQMIEAYEFYYSVYDLLDIIGYPVSL